MRERLVADWLIKAGERGGLDVAFCQVLLSQGCKILRAGHSPTEAGKDIIAVGPRGDLRAYQVKCGNIDRKAFNEIKSQVIDLVEAAIQHPNVRRGSIHEPFLVTTGTFSEPVQQLVQGLNDSWQRRRFKKLVLIGGPQLQPDLMDLAGDFWPIDPPEIRSFLSLYLSEGRGDFDRKSFAGFLKHLLPDKGISKPIASRRIAAAGIFASYLLESFHRQGDHWSAFCGWVITASYQAWAAETHKLPAKAWLGSFQITRAAAMASLERLAGETLKANALLPLPAELDDYTRARNTVASSVVAAWHLMQHKLPTDLQISDAATSLVKRLTKDGRFWFWGEGAVPHFLAIIWLLERSGEGMLAENLLTLMIDGLANRNHRLSNDPLPPPEQTPDDVLSSILQRRHRTEPNRRRRASFSWTLESLVHLTARRLRRQALALRWREISRVEMASFRPNRIEDLLLWDGAPGEEAMRLPGKPQSWGVLLADARKDDLKALPPSLRTDPDFALMFGLAYPHRANTMLVKALDTWFS